MGNVATRLISLIMLMQSQAIWKASELASELNVSERTVHRYIGMLEEMGIPLYSERGPHGGFALMRGYKLPPLIFTAEEATVLYVGANVMKKVWGKTYHDAITSVTAKLNNVLPDDVRQEVKELQRGLVISRLAVKDYTAWEPFIHKLRTCIAERQQVRLLYRRVNLEETQRDVSPYALSFHGGLWYLIGFCQLRQAIRVFRIDRIQSIHSLKAHFSIPRDFSAHDYLEKNMHYEINYNVVVELGPHIAPIIKEHSGHWMEIESHADGCATARFGASDLNWAAGWVLSYGAEAKAVAPPELVERIKQQLKLLYQNYFPSVG